MKEDHRKLDLAKLDKTYYTADSSPQLVQFGELPYLVIIDKGAPDSSSFTNATEALYSVAYGVKNICKTVNKDFTVAKLEGLWWVESDKDALEVPREEWHWKLLIRMPDFVTNETVDNARANARAKKKELEQIERVAYTTIREGTSVQMMHVGPYSTEPATVAIIREYMRAHHLIQNGLHHEIYLSDPRKVEPAYMKTILRFPVDHIQGHDHG
ncbi:GyrI-like domain-containing protein [Paenibacillus sp. HWE-109]|uniref:GyrI-like domain-containing protein n=1 Tax=Paenibacillus sp. HWE-109 TaxID=1306526 RepID=UPI001EDDACCE|nr:GyrI-like domain-containing protein [Paenibacillus sp. HWE-109]UKS27938.1 GyrI-like domain-containing protein [Paenibacillus sp. HWE-109]